MPRHMIITFKEDGEHGVSFVNFQYNKREPFIAHSLFVSLL